MLVRAVHYLLMITLILLSFAFGLTGPEWHEAAGLAFVAAAISHSVLNRWWFQMLVHRRSMIGLSVQVTNALLFTATAVMTVTGLMQSHLLSSVIPPVGAMDVRTWHTMAAYWMFVLAAWHIGLHVPVWTALKNKFLPAEPAAALFVNKALGLLLAAMAIYGLYFAYIRGFADKLFGMTTFDFWDFEAAPIGFFIGYLCTAIFIAVIPALWTKAKMRYFK